MASTTHDPSAPQLGAAVTSSTEHTDGPLQAEPVHLPGAFALGEGHSPSVANPPSPPSSVSSDDAETARVGSRTAPVLTGDDIRKVAELFELLERWSRMPAANDNVELDLSGGSDPSTAK